MENKTYSKITDYEMDINPFIRKIKEICIRESIPMLFMAASENTPFSTHYSGGFVSPDSLGMIIEHDVITPNMKGLENYFPDYKEVLEFKLPSQTIIDELAGLIESIHSISIMSSVPFILMYYARESRKKKSRSSMQDKKWYTVELIHPHSIGLELTEDRFTKLFKDYIGINDGLEEINMSRF